MTICREDHGSLPVVPSPHGGGQGRHDSHDIEMSEFSLIQRFFAARGASPLDGPGGLRVGIGDDCAVFSLAADEELVITTDTLVSGVHFPEDSAAELVGQRALRVNLSDIAAMGGHACWFMLALTLPNDDESWLQAFCDGLFSAAREYGCGLIGGNTTRGPLTISITACGRLPRGQALLRSGASADDEIYVTGTLGDAAAALRVIGSSAALGPANENDNSAWLLKRYWQPSPRLAEGLILRGLASAAIDISDGLLADLGHLADASGLGAELWLDALPESSALRAVVTDCVDRHALAVTGGDDYELCFTVSPQRVSLLEAEISAGRLSASRVGRMVTDKGVRCYDNSGKQVNFVKSGYQHF